MPPTAYLFDLLKITLPIVIMLVGILILVRSFLGSSQEKRASEIRSKTLEKTLPLKLNAYERLLLFIERINPASLLLRNYESGMSARELQIESLKEVRTEFDHNITQQLYVSENVWAIVKKVKDETVMMINGHAMNLPEGAGGADLNRFILDSLGKMELNPYEYALTAIKDEAREVI